MPRQRKEPPEIYADKLARLEPDELKYIRDTLNNPVFVKFLRVVETMKPSCFAAGTYGTLINQNTALISAMQLARQQGWEAHITGMQAAIMDKPQRKAVIEATYPDSGRDNLENHD